MKLTLEQLNKTIDFFDKLPKKEINKKYFANENEYELYCRMFGIENVVKIEQVKSKTNMEYDFYEDILKLVSDIRNELTLEESINKLNSYILWLLNKKEENE